MRLQVLHGNHAHQHPGAARLLGLAKAEPSRPAKQPQRKQPFACRPRSPEAGVNQLDPPLEPTAIYRKPEPTGSLLPKFYKCRSSKKAENVILTCILAQGEAPNH